jgi:glycosyltransferase involved in cell wall biosynthesis
MRIAYFINQYPKVSHSFIRREILALERQGFEIQRIACVAGMPNCRTTRMCEQGKTQYVLQGGVKALLKPALQVLRQQPRRFFASLWLALRLGRRADRAWPYHLIYLAEACRVLQWLQASGAVHVHAHFGTNSTEVVMLARALGGPAYSFTVHGPEEFDKPQFLHVGEKVRRAAFVAAVSSYGRSQLFRWVAHEHWDKVKVVHCGLERSFHDVPAVAAPSAPRLVCVGRLCEQKGQLLLLEAARLLAAQAVEFELVLAGDGEMREQLEALIARHGLQAQVRITGWISSAGTRGDPRRPRAGLAKLRRGLAGGDHGSHGLAPPGADHLCGGYPRAGNARRERLAVPGGGRGGTGHGHGRLPGATCARAAAHGGGGVSARAATP